MSKYECQQCKETSILPFAGGKCSKCGSLNIRNLEHLHTRKPKKGSEDSKKSLLMMLLWGFIIYEAWKQLG